MSEPSGDETMDNESSSVERVNAAPVDQGQVEDTPQDGVPQDKQALHNDIVHRWHQRQSKRGIARALGISRWQVERTIRVHAKARDGDSESPVNADLPSATSGYSSKLDRFEVQITKLLERYPNMTATRVFEELKQLGYEGGYTIVRRRVKRMRSKPTKPLTVRFETAPGVQAQMDWAVYDINFTQEGKRRVNLFSYILGYSRRQYLHFTERQDFDATIRQHIQAFEHLGGLAATCLYDNMKVVVTRWEDDQPIYNTRFLAFATHYGYRPWACRPRRPETKGKVERPFRYVETSLLNGRTFRTLEHLNEVTRWWLANVNDVRVHRTTKKRPIDAHSEEKPHLLTLPEHNYDTATVIYRVVNSEGHIIYANNQYSVPWRLVGELLPVRVTETEILVYNRNIQQVAKHLLLQGQTGQQQVNPAHRPPPDHGLQLEQLRLRFSELSEVASRFLDGLLKKQRCGKHQAQKVLALLGSYHREDLLAAMTRAVRYHAYSLASLQRILDVQAKPKASLESLTESEQEMLRKLSQEDSIEARSSSAYQYLLFDEDDSDASQTTEQPNDPGPDRTPPGNTQNPDHDGESGRDPQ